MNDLDKDWSPNDDYFYEIQDAKLWTTPINEEGYQKIIDLILELPNLKPKKKRWRSIDDPIEPS